MHVYIRDNIHMHTYILYTTQGIVQQEMKCDLHKAREELQEFRRRRYSVYMYAYIYVYVYICIYMYMNMYMYM